MDVACLDDDAGVVAVELVALHHKHGRCGTLDRMRPNGRRRVGRSSHISTRRGTTVMGSQVVHDKRQRRGEARHLGDFDTARDHFHAALTMQ
ncbi:hypothetical protein GCM10017774_05240 [Lentzea cavernae]|uniref:Tetratricopeptide repeat-containing protein n=1 Tax=Lentzea cavernae TaxID=2020703 RepID=A0ABQ3LZ86_9PSEU|nr:hypothetical protein GCM10017774_05240 [Lentzea cavernae]